MFKFSVFLLFLVSLTLNSQIRNNNQNDSINIKKLEEVIVTATKTYRILSSLPIPAQIISDTEILNSNAVRLTDILNEQIGLITVTDFGGGEGIQLQGLDSQYTLVLIDGFPVIGRLAGTLDINRFTTGNIKQIEIIRGASSSLYGSEAIGGVINIITKDASHGLNANVNYLLSTNNTIDGNVGFNYKENKTGFSINANFYKTDGYDLNDDDGFNTVNPFKNYTINIKNKFDFSDKISLAMSGRLFNQVQDNMASSDLSGKSTIDEWNISLKTIYSASAKFTNSIELYKTNYYTKEHLKTGDGLIFSNSYYNHDLSHLELKSIYLPKKNQTYVLGFGYKNEILERTYFANKAEFKSTYIYMQYDFFKNENLNIIFGHRYDNNDKYKSQLSPKFAIRYNFNDKISIRGSLGYGYKAPDFRQLYFNFTNSTIGYTVLGYNAILEVLPRLISEGQISNIIIPLDEFKGKLKAERSTSINLGLGFNFNEEISTNVNLFFNNVSNLIDTRVVANKINGQNVFSYYNINEVMTYGVEFKSYYNSSNNFKISAGYQLLFAYDKKGIKAFSDGEIYARQTTTSSSFKLQRSDYFGLYNRSRHMGFFKLDFNSFNSKLNSNIRLTYRSKYGIYDTNNNSYLDAYDEFVNGYFIKDIALNKKINEHSKISVGVNNLFDFKDVNNIASISGRIFYSKINIQL